MSSPRNPKFLTLSDTDIENFLANLPLLTDKQLDHVSMEVFAETAERDELGNKLDGTPPWEDS